MDIKTAFEEILDLAMDMHAEDMDDRSGEIIDICEKMLKEKDGNH